MDSPDRKGGPRSRQSRETEGTQLPFNLLPYQHSFDKEAFNQLVRSQGIKLLHYRAMPDPSGMSGRGDSHAVQSQRQSSDGFLYKEVGTVQAFFSGNSSDFNVKTEGLIKHDTAVLTLAENYDNCEDPILVAPYDRFFCTEVELRVINMQYLEASSIGIDKLQYPATCVEWLVDADGIEYKEGKEFEITKEGHIKWISQQRPGWNEKTHRGTVYSIRYRYMPYWVTARLLHEARVSQITDPLTFERKIERMPYQILVIREHVLSDVNRDPNSNIMDTRFQDLPPIGGATGPNDDNQTGGML
jgi:hypothetical protein